MTYTQLLRGRPMRLRHLADEIQLTRGPVARYADRWGLSEADARYELEQLLRDATRTRGELEGLERWRARSKTTGMDLRATIRWQGSVAVVVHLRFRQYGRGRAIGPGPG